MRCPLGALLVVVYLFAGAGAGAGAGKAAAAGVPPSPVVRSASGANPAEIQPAVDQFRADLGEPLNPSQPVPFGSGRRER